MATHRRHSSMDKGVTTYLLLKKVVTSNNVRKIYNKKNKISALKYVQKYTVLVVKNFSNK